MARHRASLAPSSSFQVCPLGQVMEHARKLAFAANLHLADRQVDRKQCAVTSTTGDLTASADNLRLARCEIALEILVMLFVRW